MFVSAYEGYDRALYKKRKLRFCAERTQRPASQRIKTEPYTENLVMPAMTMANGIQYALSIAEIYGKSVTLVRPGNLQYLIA